MPITGDTVVVNMVFNPPAAYSFEPMDVTIKAGDGIKFVTVSGQPHNVRLDPPPGTLPAALRAQLNANMTNKGGELMSPIIINPGEVYIISFAGVPAGTRIPIDCPLHIAQGMRGSVTIQ
jgi:plastocyanin